MTDFFTTPQSDYLPNKGIGDPRYRDLYKHENDYTGYLNMRPSDADDSEELKVNHIKSESWDVYEYAETTITEEETDDEPEHGYTTYHYGYNYRVGYPDLSAPPGEFQEKNTRKVPF